MKTAAKLRHVLYAFSFFFSIHLAITAYVNSTFVESIVGKDNVGLLYSIASIFGISIIFYLPHILKKIGTGVSALCAIVLHMLALYGLVASGNGIILILSFIFYLITNTAIIYFIDIFLETETVNTDVGKTRGLYLTIVNLAWVVSPLIAGAVLSASGYKTLYFLGFLAMIPVFLFIIFLLKHFKDPVYHVLSFGKMLKVCYKERDIGRIWVANFILQFFYTWMVIYTPIYLHQYIGLPWSDIGIIFTIMLLPFVLIQYPLGKIADAKIGEKELLLFGFAIMGVSTYMVSTMHSTSVLMWGALLFMTRVGASIVEVMTETYFFKKVHPSDSELIALFRNTSPLSYVIAPIIATLLLLILPIHLLFVVLAFVILIGFGVSIRLKDTL